MSNYELPMLRGSAYLVDVRRPKTKRPVARNNKEAMKQQLIKAGTVLKDCWRVEGLISEGGFGQIYRASDISDPNVQVAVKAESSSAQLPLLHVEVLTLQSLERQEDRRHFVQFFGGGRTNECNYVLMQLCGSNVRQLKKSMAGDRFSASTSLRLAVQMVEAVRDLHRAGWLHRDVKPSNFCMGLEPHKQRTLFIIDFGLARAYKTHNGTLKNERSHSGFHGTVRYASTVTHKHKDMARVDDIWSVFYMAVEMLCSQLPWRQIIDKPKAQNIKETTDFGTLLEHLEGGRSLLVMEEHLQTLHFYSRPNYELILNAFKQDLHLIDAHFSDPFDWEAVQVL